MVCDALRPHADVAVVDTAVRSAVWRRPGTVPLASVRAWSAGLHALRRHLADRPDVLYLTPASSALGAFRDALAVALVPPGVRIVAHVHAGDYGARLAQPVGGLLARRVARRAERLLVPSEYAAARIRAAVPGLRVEVAPNPVPPDVRFAPGEKPESSPTGRGEGPRVLFLSNMIPSKGYARLADALAVLARRGVRVDATFAGAWTSRASRRAFERRLLHLGLADRTTVAGTVSRSDVRAHLAAADVFVFPSTYPHESFGLALLEAMGAGCAVVAVRHAATAEIVRDGIDGRLVDATPSALADGLADVLAHRARYAAAAAARVRDAFPPEALTARLVAAVLGREPEPAPSAAGLS